MSESTKEVTIRKSGLAAENDYEFHKLCYEREGFLSCVMVEEKEEIHVTYDIGGRRPLEQIRQEKRNVQLVALMDIHKLEALRALYQFSLTPANLYYDRHQSISVMERDVYVRGNTPEAGGFLVEYKAVIGYVLQSKYSYEDYLNGGMDLLKKHKFLQRIHGCATVAEIEQCLLEEHDRFLAEVKATKIEVPKKRYRGQSAGLFIAVVCLILTTGFGGYCAYWILPYQASVMQADAAYLESNYIEVVDALKNLDIARLEKHQKYMLAESYIRSENLTEEQRGNVLSAVAVNGDVKVMNYWIHIGRLEPEKAADIALQLSDNQMLLYAYLKEKYLVEIDSSMTGEEKREKLTELEGKITELSKEYEAENEAEIPMEEMPETKLQSQTQAETLENTDEEV